MADPVIRITINGRPLAVRPGTTVAAALQQSGEAARISVGGEPRGPLCGMGICYECRAVVDGVRHVRTCIIDCADGMEVRTDV